VRGAVIWEDLTSPSLRHVPHYSTEIAAAWLVVEHLRAQGRRIMLDALPPDEWLCVVGAVGEPWRWCGYQASAPTASLAICRASLMAMEGE
jgi:hypothetical protein